MRGDRPKFIHFRVDRDQATPHARGSTLNASRHSLGVSGYPACAGIDPISQVNSDIQ